MKMFKAAALFALGFAVSGCSFTETASRNASFEAAAAASVTPQEMAQLIEVVGVEVNVPRTLKVSEAALFYPIADIVWRGEERGDRYTQVSDIFRASASRATRDLNRNVGQKVKVVVDVTRFHALTDKARYTVGGVHSINFILSVKDTGSGIDLMAPRKVKADLKAFGGQAALAADHRGETQKKRISDHLVKVIRSELASAVASVAGPVVSRNAQAVDALPKGHTTVY